MCKFLLELFSKPKEPDTKPETNTETVDYSGDTVVITNNDVDNHDDNNDVDVVDNDENNENEQNNTMTMSTNEIEVEKKINDFAVDMSKGKTRTVNQIAVHCTATPEGRNVTMSEIDSWHKARGFSKQKISGHYCGYHFVVALDGTIMCGRDLREIGAHVSGYNSKSIGVCYVGGLDANGKAKDTRTPEQKKALRWLIGKLKRTLNISKVKGHRDYSPDTNGNGVIESFEWIKSCPCFDAIPEYKDI